MKKLTLNQAWTLCLKQWKWIIAELDKDSNSDVYCLKKEWCERNYNYKVANPPQANPSDDVWEFCFFCEYNRQHRDKAICSCCPGKLVDKTLKDFWCQGSNLTNHYWENMPYEFYAKLLELNKKRLAKKRKVK